MLNLHFLGVKVGSSDGQTLISRFHVLLTSETCVTISVQMKIGHVNIY